MTTHANGRLPESALARTRTGHRAAPEAAASYDRMGAHFERDLGYPLTITDGYRDLDEQILVKAIKGALAAIPGTSVHGLGLALDLGAGVQSATSRAHRWMVEHAAAYGWVNPWWARDHNPRNGAQEPWHWEYVAHLDQHAGATLATRPTAPELPQGDQLMFIVTRTGDEAAYLVGPTSMTQLTFDQAQALIAAGVPVRRLNPAQVLSVMAAIHNAADNEARTQVATGAHK